MIAVPVVDSHDDTVCRFDALEGFAEGSLDPLLAFRQDEAADKLRKALPDCEVLSGVTDARS